MDYLGGIIYSDTRNFEPYARAILFPVDWDRTAKMQSLAFYGRATFHVTADTALTAGLRYQHDAQSYHWIFNDGTAPESRGSHSYDFVSGEVSLQHDFARDVKGYVTYANAQTGKAYDLEDNASAATPSGLQPLPSEKVQSIEAGIKSQWLDRRLTVNLSAFRSDYHNYQVQSLIVSNNINTVPTIRLYAIGKVRTQGIELQSSFAVSRALRLDFYATYLDAKIRDYPGAQCFLGQTVAQGCVNAIQNRRGVLPGTSKFRMIASANYTLAMPDMPFDGTFSAFYRYQTETFFDLFGDPLSKQGAYGIVNLSVGAKSHSGLWSAEIFVNNVANRHYYTGVVHDSFQPNGALALHATYGRDANRYFGGRLSFHF